MPVSAPRIPRTVQGVSGSDYGSANVLPVCIANANPSVVGSFAVQVTRYGFAAQIVNHPALSVLTGSRSKLWSIHAVQAHRRSIDNYCVGISYMKGASISGYGGKQGSYNKAFYQSGSLSKISAAISLSPS